jgi:hypothetical protein
MLTVGEVNRNMITTKSIFVKNDAPVADFAIHHFNDKEKITSSQI